MNRKRGEQNVHDGTTCMSHIALLSHESLKNVCYMLGFVVFDYVNHWIDCIDDIYVICDKCEYVILGMFV